MNLHAFQAQLNSAVDLPFYVRIVLVHSGKADELGMHEALIGNERVDGLHLTGRRGHRVHNMMGDRRTLAGCEQSLGRGIGRGHGHAIEVAHGIRRL